MKPDAKRQGHLDGLCGIYAIINAFRVVTGKATNDKDVSSLFETCCRSVSAWPSTLWEGMDFEAMEDVIARAKIYEHDLFKNLRITYPFKESTPKTSELYWARFSEIFESFPNGCAIIGRTHPDMHWVAVTVKSEKQLNIHDSSPFGSTRVKNISQIHAGDRLPEGKHWKIARDEFVFFRSV